jgi:hypothetical protein
MADPVTWIAVAGVAISAVSAGVSYYGQQEQAKSTSAMANYNAEVARQNADLQYRVAQRNDEYQRKIIEANQSVQIDASKVIQTQQTVAFDQAREDINRQRKEKEQLIARQRASYASSGVLLEGSPLEVLAETAGVYQLQAADALYKADLQDRELDYKQRMAAYGANVEGFRTSLLDIQSYADRIGKRQAYSQAELNRLSGMNQASGMRTAAVGTLLSGVSNAASSASSLYAQNRTPTYSAR